MGCVEDDLNDLTPICCTVSLLGLLPAPSTARVVLVLLLDRVTGGSCVWESVPRKDLRGCCRMGESLLNDMAAVSLEDPAEAREAELEKAPPLAFGAVVKKQHKWQVLHHAPRHALLQCFNGWRPNS